MYKVVVPKGVVRDMQRKASTQQRADKQKRDTAMRSSYRQFLWKRFGDVK